MTDKNNHTHVPAQFDIDTLMSDIKNNGAITRGFNKTSTDNRVKIFEEYRINFDEYLEYALIFHEDPKDAQDLVQHAFISAYEASEELEPDTNMRFWLLSHMQQELENEQNSLFLISRQLIETTHAENKSRTIGETMHLLDIQKQISKTLQQMDSDDMLQVVGYLKDQDESRLSDNIRQKLSANQDLKDLYLGHNTPD